MLNNGDERGPRWLSAYGRDVDQFETQLARDPETNRLTVTGGGTRAAARRSLAMDAIVRWLTDSEEPLTKRDLETLGDANQVKRQAVRDGVEALVSINQVIVEPGPNRSILHRLNPQFAGVPQCADGSPAHSLAGVPPYVVRHTANTVPAGIPLGEPSDEQQALLEQIDAAPATGDADQGEGVATE